MYVQLVYRVEGDLDNRRVCGPVRTDWSYRSRRRSNDVHIMSCAAGGDRVTPAHGQHWRARAQLNQRDGVCTHTSRADHGREAKSGAVSAEYGFVCCWAGSKSEPGSISMGTSSR